MVYDSNGMESEQEQTLEETLRAVKSHAFEMKRSLDRKEIKDGLRHVNNMLNELRTPSLSPKFYYRLCKWPICNYCLDIDVTNELQHFLSYLSDEYLAEDGVNKVAELYELVQFAVNIVPRLYLMITVGVVYIKSKEAPCKDVLKDMVEMCRGVQHPLKGLFLRNYLLSCTKELLPINSPEDSGADGNINDSLEIVMTNFSEMNKLWGPSREKEKRERERRELRILVGTNLVRLSQLELLDLEMYQKAVLPGILEQAVSCREPISQEYLLECVIQVFPDEFHLATLSEFLAACVELHPFVQIKNVLCAVIDRLTAFAVQESNPNIPAEYKLFEVFSEHSEQVISAREDMLPEDIVTIQKALANLAIKCYPTKTEYANTVFQATASIFNRLKIKDVPSNNNLGKELVKLLVLPVEAYSNCLTVLELEAFKSVLDILGYKGRTHVCQFLIKTIIEKEVDISEENDLDRTLLIDQVDQPENLASNEDFQEEQELVASLLHRIRNEDPEIHLKEDSDAKLRKLFQFCINTILALKSETESFELCLNLFLQGALVADQTDFEDSATVAYEFMSNAFTIFEEELTDSRTQVHCLNQMIGTVQRLSNLPEENHEPLRNQCAMYGSRLLKKADQAKALCSVAHLFWHSHVKECENALKDSKRVAECLKKAIKVTSQCMEDLVQLSLYVHVLSNYVYFFELGCDSGILQTAKTLKTENSEELAKLLEAI